MRRHSPTYSSLTSLLDVLFLLLFAALVQRAALAEESDADRSESPAEVADAGPPDAARELDAGAADRQLRDRSTVDRGLHVLEERLRSGVSVVVRVVDQRIVSLSLRDTDGSRTLEIDRRLTEPSPDPDIGLFYLGDENPNRQLCTMVASELGVALEGAFVVVELDRSVDELPVALVDGLASDERRCARDGASAVILSPSASEE